MIKSNLKKNVLIFLLVLFSSSIVFSQEIGVEDVLSQMQEQLNLTPQQVNEIRPIIISKLARLKSLKTQKNQQGSILVPAVEGQQNLLATVVEDKKGDLDKKEQAQLSQILTQEQMSKWDSIQSQIIKDDQRKTEEAIRNGEYPSKEGY